MKEKLLLQKAVLFCYKDAKQNRGVGLQCLRSGYSAAWTAPTRIQLNFGFMSDEETKLNQKAGGKKTVQQNKLIGFFCLSTFIKTDPHLNKNYSSGIL